MNAKVVVIVIVLVLLASGGAYYFGYQRGYDKGTEAGAAAAKVGAGAAVETPLGEMPTTNPFEKVVNPFKDLYTNPFK